MKPLLFAHVGMIVPSVKEALKKYSSIFGSITASQYEFKPLTAWFYKEPLYDCELKIGLIEIVPDLKIELIEPVSIKTPHNEFLKNTGGGLHHIAYKTDDYEWWMNYFTQQGTDILFEAEAKDEVRGYRRCFYVDLGFKHIIELFSNNLRTSEK